MIIVAAAVLGALMGIATARRRGGRPLDQLHYATGFAIAFGIVGLFATIFLDRIL